VDASSYTARVVGWDAGKDVAVLRLSMPKSRLKELRPARLAPAPAGVRVGCCCCCCVCVCLKRWGPAWSVSQGWSLVRGSRMVRGSWVKDAPWSVGQGWFVVR